jgi:hypothetical protein
MGFAREGVANIKLSKADTHGGPLRMNRFVLAGSLCRASSVVWPDKDCKVSGYSGRLMTATPILALRRRRLADNLRAGDKNDPR